MPKLWHNTAMAGQIRSAGKGSNVVVPKVETVPIDEIIENTENPRTHSPGQIARLADSIREFGFLVPVVLRGRQLVAGHGRLMAARRAGLREVPAVQADHLDEHMAKAYMLADNRIAELAGWDEELLREALEDLQASGMAHLAAFDHSELEKLLGASLEEPSGESAEDDGLDRDPSIRITISVPGEVWIGNRDKILEMLEKASKKFMWRMKVDE